MTEQEYVKSLAKEASVYRTQGLYEESKQKYVGLLLYLGKSQRFGNNNKLIMAVKSRIRDIEDDVAAVKKLQASPGLSEGAQDLIRQLFSFSSDKDAATAEGAIALARFGQYEQALSDFHKLMEQGSLTFVAAKNIISCLLAFSSPNVAIAQYKQWISRKSLSQEELKYIKEFLDKTLEKKGVRAKLPSSDLMVEGTEKDETHDGLPEMSSVAIEFRNGPLKDKTVDLDVSFQCDNMISVIISAESKDVLETLRLGRCLPYMQCYSSRAVFRGSGIVFRKFIIKGGPRQGDYVVDITVDI